MAILDNIPPPPPPPVPETVPQTETVTHSTSLTSAAVISDVINDTLSQSVSQCVSQTELLLPQPKTNSNICNDTSIKSTTHVESDISIDIRTMDNKTYRASKGPTGPLVVSKTNNSSNNSTPAVLRCESAIIAVAPTDPKVLPASVRASTSETSATTSAITSGSGNGTSLERSSTQGYKGVTFDTRNSKWRSQIRHDGKLHYLGLFTTGASAARAYDTFVRRHVRTENGRYVYYIHSSSWCFYILYFILLLCHIAFLINLYMHFIL